jgi:chemotaxis protein CheX
MDARDIVPFVRSVQNVFDTMLQVHVDTQKPRVREASDPCYDVSGIIGMSGDVSGLIVLSFPTDTAERLVTLFTGVHLDADHEDFADAIGELVNMVAGGAKAQFDHRSVSISCPSVVVGAQHRVFSQKSRPIIEIPSDCECGPFSVMVSMKDEKEGPLVSADTPVAAGESL